LGLQRPRRIFRGSAYAEPGAVFGMAVRGAMVIGLAGAVAGGAMVLISRPAGLFHRDVFGGPSVVSGTVIADPWQVAVVDGGTLRLRDTVVRLAGLAAPERGHTCPDGLGGSYDCGTAATAALADLVRNRAVSCRLGGRDGFGLAQGACDAAGTDLGQAMVAAGWARARPETAMPVFATTGVAGGPSTTAPGGSIPGVVGGSTAPAPEGPIPGAANALSPTAPGGPPPGVVSGGGGGAAGPGAIGGAGLADIEAEARTAQRGLWRNGADPGF
jgi:hypothetical protein